VPDPPRSRTVVQAVLCAGLAGAFALACAFPAIRHDPAPLLLAAGVPSAFVLVGIWPSASPALRAVSGPMVVSAVLWSCGWLYIWGQGPLTFVSYEAANLFWVVACWGVLRYPNARVVSRLERAYFAALVVCIPVLWTFIALVSKPAWNYYGDDVWWPTVWADRGLRRWLVDAGDTIDLSLAALFVLLMHRRLRASNELDRVLIAPVGVALILAAVTGAVTSVFCIPLRRGRLDPVFCPQSLAALTIPLAFGAAALERRLVRAEFAEIFIRTAGASVGDIRDSLRRTLRDPSLEVFAPTVATPLPAATAPTVIPVRATDGTPLARVVGGSELRRHRDLVEEAVAASAMRLENHWLRERLSETRERSRAEAGRILEVGVAERRQLGRALHTGAQSRLTGLAGRLRATGAAAGEPAAAATIAAAHDELLSALRELTDLARGIHPSALREAGIRPAVTLVADSLPLPVRLDLPAGRFDEMVEATVYFTVCEALTNVVRHAGATKAGVHVTVLDGALRVEVVDDGQGLPAGRFPPADGTGRANVPPANVPLTGVPLTGVALAGTGSGLAGLAERAAQLGGELTVGGRPGGGTRLTMVLPTWATDGARPGRPGCPG